MKLINASVPFLAVALLGDTYPRQPGVDALHYTFRLVLRDTTNEIAGDATVDLRFLQPGVTGFALDLGDPMTVDGVASAGQPLHYTHEAGRLEIVLAAPARAGERRQFEIRYHGVPAAGLRIGPDRWGDRTFFSSNWPDKARQWLPLIDHPYDKATSEFLVTAPAPYQVVANGLLVEETDLGDGTRLTHWKQSVPIASWLNALGVAPFAARHFGTAHGVPLQTWVERQDRDNGIATFEMPTRQAMDFYSDAIGPYPYEKLADVEAAGVNGGMEHASAIFYGERSVTSRPAAGLVAHEIAHQWFGDSVTEKDWDDVWLSEGFATYFALLFTEHYDGRDAFVAGLERSSKIIFEIERKNPGLAVLHENLADMRQVLNGLVYQKGAWTLHMLRGLIGTDKFWAGIREYYRRYRDANASTADFEQVMEETSGTDLSWFFSQWLGRPGSPMVSGAWRYDPAAHKVELDLAQSGAPYRLPLEVALDDRIESIEFTAPTQHFSLSSPTEPHTVTLDPHTWVLMQSTFSQKK